MSIAEDLGLTDEQIYEIAAELDARHWLARRQHDREDCRVKWLNRPDGTVLVKSERRTHWPDCPVIASRLAIVETLPGSDDPDDDFWLIDFERMYPKWVTGDRPTCKRCLRQAR